jgi:hypothetical protein
MSRLSQAFAFFNLEPEKFTSEWSKFNMTDLTVNEGLKKLRREHRKDQKNIKKEAEFDKTELEKQMVANEEFDLNLVIEGKMTKEEYRNKWVK